MRKLHKIYILVQQDNASEERHYSGGDKSVMHSGIFGTMDMVGIHAHGVLADHGGGGRVWTPSGVQTAPL